MTQYAYLSMSITSYRIDNYLSHDLMTFGIVFVVVVGDWIVGNSIAERLGRLGQLRYLIKDQIKLFPVYGFYFYHHGCIYLKRGQCNFTKVRQGLSYLRSKLIPVRRDFASVFANFLLFSLNYTILFVE